MFVSSTHPFTEELLDKALDFAKNYTTITKQDRQIIM